MMNLTSVIRTVTRSILGTGVLLLASSAPSFAQNLAGTVSGSVGHWRITFSLDPNSSAGGTQCITFTRVNGSSAGEPNSGTWLSPTFAGWRGRWIQEGDHFRFYGFTSSGLGTAEWGALVNNNSFAGEFAHFVPPNGTTSSSGSFQATRVASCAGIAIAPQAAGGDPSSGAGTTPPTPEER